MNQNMRIIDYVIEQAERYDLNNLRYEDDVIHRILSLHRNMNDEIMRLVEIYGDIPTVLAMQKLVMKIEDTVTRFYNGAVMCLSRSVFDYTAISFKQLDDLIDIGLEVENRTRSIKTLEMKKKVYDENAIAYMRDHAMEQVKWMSNDVMNKVRAGLGELVLQGRGNKVAVREKLQKTLNINKSKAEEIAQTELSMAYNVGALHRIEEFNSITSGNQMRKYWHGFKYSTVTCTYCRPRIGMNYDYDDSTEHLPAHPRCRCVWLPFMNGWDKPISTIFTRSANMLNRVYTPDDIYARINMRLNIDYGKYIPIDTAVKYLGGDRTADMGKALQNARSLAINDIKATFDIAAEDAKSRMANEFNTQISFWKGFIASNIADKDIDTLSRSYEAVKGMMVLPWSGSQLEKWNSLLLIIRKHI